MVSQDFLARTLDTWQPYYNDQLQSEDALDIATNWSAFITVISEWLATKEGLADIA